jgi:hypothetical protein
MSMKLMLRRYYFLGLYKRVSYVPSFDLEHITSYNIPVPYFSDALHFPYSYASSCRAYHELHCRIQRRYIPSREL